jgi:hypothetical protein
MRRPLTYVLGPARWAHENDRDGLLLGWVLAEGAALLLLWGLFGGAVSRLAAVDLTNELRRDRREDARDAFRFARRHWGGVVGARALFWGGAAAAIVLACLAASLGRLPGALGDALGVVGAALCFALAFAGVMLASVHALSGFVTGPTVACEDSDAFDAVSRVFTYAASGPPRLLAVRLLFLGGVLLGSGWRLLRTVAAGLLGWLCLSAGAGAERISRATAILGATGTPSDASRLHLGAFDYALAAVIALAVGGLAALWLADLVSRVICARVGAYLVLRRDVDGVPPASLRTPPKVPGHRGAEEAGFVEVGRIEG